MKEPLPLNMLTTTYLHSPLGPLKATATNTSLHSLHFAQNTPSPQPLSPLLQNLQQELDLYFQGKLTTFSISLHPTGTSFQRTVWKALLDIPFGTTCSYQELATAIGKPTAFRAVALANSQNPLAILIPCHRVIYKNGSLGGYAGGTHNKQRLLNHEKCV